MSMIQGTIIITAGGSGKRMGYDIPKQFIELNGKPILMHTIANLNHLLKQFKVVVTLPENEIESWNKLCGKHHFEVQHEVVAGGKERFHSVKNALIHAEGEVVLIHDGVRPFVSKQIIDDLLVGLKTHSGVIPVIAPIDSLREGQTHNSKPVDRSKFHCVQTPQVFQKNKIVKAYDVEYKNSFTDDASVLEAKGEQVLLVEGTSENIKITRPLDMVLAKYIFENFKP